MTTAKMPSLKAASRPVLCPAMRLYGVLMARELTITGGGGQWGKRIPFVQGRELCIHPSRAASGAFLKVSLLTQLLGCRGVKLMGRHPSRVESVCPEENPR